MISVDRVNQYGANFTVVGWYSGLVWAGWIKQVPNLSLLDWLILIVGGMFGSALVIGGGLSVIAAIITKIATGKSDGSATAYAWVAFIAPMLAFLAATPVARLLS